MSQRTDSIELRETYRAYLIRLWRDTPRAQWRVSAQSAETGEVIRFADLNAIFSFLHSQTSTPAMPVTLGSDALEHTDL